MSSLVALCRSAAASSYARSTAPDASRQNEDVQAAADWLREGESQLKAL
jgi:hypothetical protein